MTRPSRAWVCLALFARESLDFLRKQVAVASRIQTSFDCACCRTRGLFLALVRPGERRTSDVHRTASPPRLKLDLLAHLGNVPPGGGAAFLIQVSHCTGSGCSGVHCEFIHAIDRACPSIGLCREGVALAGLQDLPVVRAECRSYIQPSGCMLVQAQA